MLPNSDPATASVKKIIKNKADSLKNVSLQFFQKI